MPAGGPSYTSSFAMDPSICDRDTPTFTLVGIACPAKVVTTGAGGLIEVAFDTPGFGLRKHCAYIAQSKARSLKMQWQLESILLNKVFGMRVVGLAVNGDLLVQLTDLKTGENVRDDLPERKPSSHPDGPFSASSFAD